MSKGLHQAKQDLRPSILVVEDEPLVSMQLVMMLEDLGYSVVGPSSSVSEGLEKVRSAAIDAALLDVTLGKELSIPIAEELVRMGVPFAFATGYSDGAMLPEHLRSIPRISKPYLDTDLTAVLSDLVDNTI